MKSKTASRHRLQNAVSIPTSSTFWITGIGFGFCLMWGMMGTSSSLLAPEISQKAAFTATNGYAERGLWIGFLIAYALWVYFKQADKCPGHLIAAVATGACVTAGTAIAYLTDASSSGILQLPAKLLLCSSSIFILLWGERLCTFDGESAFQCVIVSSIVSLAGVMLASATPLPLQILLHIAAPLISSAALVKLRSAKRETRRARGDKKPGLPVRSFIGIGLFGATVVLLQLFSEAKTEQPNEDLWIIAGLVVDAVLFVASILSHSEIRASFLSRFILPLLITSVFLVLATNFGQRAIEVFAIGCTWIFLKLFTWIIWRIGALKSSLPTVVGIAIGQIMLTAGTIAGELAYTMSLQMHASQLAAMASVCIVGIVASTFLLDTRYVAELTDEPLIFDPENRAICERCVDRATTKFDLSGQERTISFMLVKGLDNESIREELVITNNTLRTHLRNIYKKTETHSREELVMLLRSFA